MNDERDEILLEKVREVERRDKSELREFEPPLGSTAKLLGEERILSGPA